MDVYLQVYYNNSPFNTHNTVEGNTRNTGMSHLYLNNIPDLL